jgi:hypothetical protein
MQNNQNLSGKILSNKFATEQGLATTISVNRTSVDFDKTDIGDECFRLIKISQSGEGVPVTLSSNSPDLFQIAIGVKKLIFEDELTFSPAEGGTFVHIRFTPDRMGNHTGSLILKTANDQQIITLSGKGGNFIATPASEQISGLSSRWKWAAMLVLVGGVGYAGYMYRCQLVPSLCDQPNEVQSVEAKPAVGPPAKETTNQELEAEPVGSSKEVQEEKILKSTTTATVARPDKQVRASQDQPQSEREQDRKTTPAATRKQERRQTPTTSPTSEESELERELNKKPGS